MGTRRALIIANSEYDHSGLARLRSPAADADALAAVLSDRRISDFSVEVLHNETANVVQEHVEDLFLESAPDDVLLLHFSCHGVKSESGELYFAARNTRPHRLGSTAVPAEFVRRCMRVSRSRSIVLLLDCCYGGAFSEGVSVRAAGDVPVLDSLAGGRGRAVITASNSMEYAFEGDALAEDVTRPSVFTSALVRGLSTGEADRDEDGLVSLNELYDYVFEQVRAANPNQTPSRDIEMQGELYLARSRRRRIKPSPMPADLAAATTDPNMFTRLGAVAELRTRLRSSNLEVAAGAFEALTTMARTDIASVAAAASDALSDVRVRPSVEELTFSSADPQVVTVRGPALARAVTVTADPWIVVSEEESGFSVTVHGVPGGVAHGRIVFSGPTGEAAVTVIAAELPPQLAESAPHPSEPAAWQLGPPDPAPVSPAEHHPPVDSGPRDERPSRTETRPQTGQPATGAPTPSTPASGAPVSGSPAGHPAAEDARVDRPASGRATAGVPAPGGPPDSILPADSDNSGRTAADRPEPAAKPMPFTAPEPGQGSETKWLAQRAAALAGAAAVLLLLAVTLESFYQGTPLYIVARTVPWHVVSVLTAAAVSAVCLLLPARAAGIGVLIATGTVASWSMGMVVGDLVASGPASFGTAFWSLLAGVLLLFVATAIALSAVQRDPDLTFHAHKADWRGHVLMASGAVVSVLLLFLAGEQVASAAEARAAESLSPVILATPLVFLALTVPITPVLAARAAPRTLQFGLVLTWATLLACTTFVYFTGFVDGGMSWMLWIPLAAAVVVTAVPRRAP